jgi:hypothetical protein
MDRIDAGIPQHDLDRIVTGALVSMLTFHGPAAHVTALVVAEGKAERAMTDGNAELMAEHDAEFEAEDLSLESNA